MFLHRFDSPLLQVPSSPSSSFIDLHWQLEPAGNLSLKDSLRIIPRRRGPQTRHVLPSIGRYGILNLIRIIQVYKLVQQPHVPGRFVRLVHDCLSRLLHESVGRCRGPEGAEEKYCKHQLFNSKDRCKGCWASPKGCGTGTYRRRCRRQVLCRASCRLLMGRIW